MKKRIIIILIVIIVLILIIPIPLRLKDGGSVEYEAILYKVIDVHKLNFNSTTGYEEGIIIEIFGIELFNNVGYEKKIDEKAPEYIVEEIVINDMDDSKTNYEFTYNEIIFKAIYTYDNWKIYDSYKIKNYNDMIKICQALIDIHPIHGKDMISYRTAEDMAYEWLQHNIAYMVLPDDNEWRNNAKDVDFDPNDQGKSIKEIYEERTEKKFNIEN